jgi:hypothetical protein
LTTIASCVVREITILPLEHPLRLAEDGSTVDRLSGGRVEIGVGAGFAASAGANLLLDRATYGYEEPTDVEQRGWADAYLEVLPAPELIAAEVAPAPDDLVRPLLNDLQHRSVAAEIVSFLEAVREGSPPRPLVRVESSGW